MDACPIPIEVCERIMGSFSLDQVSPSDLEIPPSTLQILWDPSTLPHRLRDDQSALYACALTCRAWSFCAVYLLWTSPTLHGNASLTSFLATIRTDPQRWLPIVTSLQLAGVKPVDGGLSTLISQEFPNLCHLTLRGVDFRCRPGRENVSAYWGLNTKLLRMRLPFFRGVTGLVMDACHFDTTRDLLDVVWSCPSISFLHVVNRTYSVAHTQDHLVSFTSQPESRINPCSRLKTLLFELNTIAAATYLHGSFFGRAVTTLSLQYESLGVAFGSLPRLLRGSFPLLSEINIVLRTIDPDTDGTEDRSLLHRLGDTLTSPAELRTVSIHAVYYPVLAARLVQHALVGEVESPNSGRPPLRSFFPSLTSLGIVVRYQREANYIRQALLSMRGILVVRDREDILDHRTTLSPRFVKAVDSAST